jgi:uncharacterized membrane protein YozB (DUF420 family)/cytochrome oxidase Cu insertion factor (SCO1/SenC/PrrC family)
MKEKALWALFVTLAACAVAALLGLWMRRAARDRAPDFSLVDAGGRPVTRRDLLGEVWVADFVFTRCQLTCPAMTSAMAALAERVPGARYVSFTVDPAYDTPEHLARWTSTMGVAREGWLWLSGASEEEMRRIARGFLLPAGRAPEGDADPRMSILHSEKFVIVDRHGRIRGWYSAVDGLSLRRDEAAMARLEEDLRRLLGERKLPIRKLPALNAGFNAASTVLLVAGFAFVRARRVGAHRACMLGAFLASALFLAGYLTAHYYLGSTPYPRRDWTRPLYFAILGSHSLLAAFILPLAGITLYRAFRGDFGRHRAIARWTLPLWLYVSVTGVAIYFMLYGAGG